MTSRRLLLGLLLLLGSCWRSATPADEPEDGGGADTSDTSGADSDSDTDVDSDTDGDGDTDVDSDTDSETGPYRFCYSSDRWFFGSWNAPEPSCANPGPPFETQVEPINNACFYRCPEGKCVSDECPTCDARELGCRADCCTGQVPCSRADPFCPRGRACCVTSGEDDGTCLPPSECCEGETGTDCDPGETHPLFYCNYLTDCLDLPLPEWDCYIGQVYWTCEANICEPQCLESPPRLGKVGCSSHGQCNPGFCDFGLGRCVGNRCDHLSCPYSHLCDPLIGCVPLEDECEGDTDCKLIESACNCQAVPADDPRDFLDSCLYDGCELCGTNNCSGGQVTAVCGGGICTELIP